ncbi:hypothetical protein A0H81_05447 [Grifola frondosa]|uniref:Uncharacterized protein n=1 Tax=Grifola frondosa TaxID=5627 RepID=A0A1C7MBJ6_GRIFR|nr:hypothetical protein A0H81_05447 [Grifola frondosa]
MQRQRWYSAAEPLGDGSVAIIGGFVNCGYINRNYPNVDPTFQFFRSANFRSVLWDPLTSTETDLPDMPGRIIRVYPASRGVAMLPITPENDCTPTVIFCGGSDMDDYH